MTGRTDHGRPPATGWSVLILTRYTALGASSRLRAMQFIPFLEAAGARVKHSALFDDRYIAHLYTTGNRSLATVAVSYVKRLITLFTARTYDVVWIEKELFPYLPRVADLVLYRAKVPVVIDFDDAIFHNYDSNRQGLVRWLFNGRLDRLLAYSAVVTAGNSYLADYAAAHGARDVRLLPTVVDASRYAVVPPPNDDVFRIVWIGSPSTAKYLDLVEDALFRLAAVMRICLVTIGAPLLAAFRVTVEQHAWTEATEAALVASGHVGIMPLPDEPWERGKCGYKLIQYMAAGRPVVASPVGVNVDIVTTDIGFLATTSDEWFLALRALATDAGLRSRLGAAGAARVNAEYSTDVIGPRFVEALAFARKVAL